MRQTQIIFKRLVSLHRRWITYIGIGLLSLGLCLIAQPGQAIAPNVHFQSRVDPVASVNSDVQTAQGLVEQGQQLYESGRLTEAIQSLEQAIETAVQAGDTETQIVALRNLALVYQQLRQFEQANQAIADALSLIDAFPSLQSSAFHASVLDVQGGIQLSQGQSELALNTWDEVAQIYEELGEQTHLLRNQINQSQALQKLGFYRRAIALLSPIAQQLQDQPASENQAIALRSLGDALRFVGDLDQSAAVLESSLAIAQNLQRTDLAESAQLSLANTLRAQGDTDGAIATYKMLAQSASSPELQIQALSNQISVLVETGQTEMAQSLWDDVRSQFNTVPPSQSMVFARVNVAQSYLKSGLATSPTSQEIAEFLAIATQHAQSLGDRRTESYALGTLARLYEQSDRLADAKQLNEQALFLAQTANASDISYIWQWQLGRIYKVEGDRTGNTENYQKAIGAYADAVTSLQQLRTDLVAVNAQVQVSFQESVEPIHRELVSLLLDPVRRDPTVSDIEKARDVIESLQLAELDNFFREACLDTQPVDIDQLDQHAAVLYPIMLSDRLEIVVTLPNQELRHYASPVPRSDVEALIAQLRQSLTLRVGNAYLSGMTTLYDWMIRPLASDLAASQAKTLVFVLDGALRNIPMTALYDGSSYLIEQYSIALTPGLQLVNPRPIQERELKVLSGALSESRQGFSALPNVVSEVEQIESTVPTEILLNESFTKEAIQIALEAEAEPIVHLATHGKFSSNQEDTFILTWDGQLDINALNDLLQISELNQKTPIELLVLSACQTATGDKQAALGLAGMAVRAGARSTIATLWQVNDQATAMLMEELYSELSENKASKAEALRRAQLRVLEEPQFRGHPFYWAPYILVGNWL